MELVWFANMSEEETTVPDRGKSLLRTSRSRSYGSLVRSPMSPVGHRRVEHQIQPGETLQGLALKYGVSVSAHLPPLFVFQDPARNRPLSK